MFRTIIFFCLLSFCSACSRHSLPEPIVYKVPVKPKHTIVIDPGHGGRDPGTQSTKYGYEEKTLTLATAHLISDYLRDQGYNVIMTRNADQFISLQERSKIANLQKADLFVSVHYNYSINKEVDGVEIFFYDGKQGQSEVRKIASQKLGKTVLACVLKHTSAHSRGVKVGNYAVIRETTMPAILVEGGFLSNAEELKKLKDPKYLHFMAYAIARGIETYFEPSQISVNQKNKPKT